MRVRVLGCFFVLGLTAGLLAEMPAPAAAGNLHLVESLPNGYAFYRSGKPDEEDLEEMCRRGIQEICVLAGNAEDHEFEDREHCPTLEVVYDQKQDSDEPLTEGFLAWFDAWVEDARDAGRKIAVRCNCGCHRTGRLVAYYQMRYQNLTLEDALIVMYEHGRNWWLHGNIEPQVRALADYLAGRPCSVEDEYCVRSAPELASPRSER